MKKTSWKTLAGLGLAVATWLKLSDAAPEEKKPEETPKEYCIQEYGDLTWQQYQLKLFNLDVAFEEGRLDRAIYDARRYRLVYCRNQQSIT
jgi:hypothetical protein